MNMYKSMQDGLVFFFLSLTFSVCTLGMIFYYRTLIPRRYFKYSRNELKSKCKARVSTGVNQCHSVEVKPCQFIPAGDVPYGYFFHLSIGQSWFCHHR